jgi:uncharacterized protein (TIGR03435 family)
MTRYKALLLTIALGFAVVPMFPQNGNAPRPSFEVASIKPAGPVVTRISIMVQPGGRLIAESFSLKMLVGRAYNVTDSRIIGGPSWVDSDRFNIEAKAQGNMAPGQMGLLIQSLLEDRFQLRVHRETRELPVYELVVAKGGPKIKLSEDQTPPAPQGPRPMEPATRGAAPGQRGMPDPFSVPQPRGNFGRGNGQMRGTAVGLAPLVIALSQQLGRPVYDKTGLTGLYDYSVKWTPGAEQAPGPFPEAPPPPSVDSGPSIFTALQEQLGLRLESTRGPVEVIVIDSAVKPSEN